MMSAFHIQQILHTSSATENQISQHVLVPLLDKISTLSNHNLRGIRFTGGRDEQGTDTEYYELIGPDKFRLYTGIQVKKTDLGRPAATTLIRQGTAAFQKAIIDPADGRSYRLHSWIVATTGNIPETARQRIHAEVDRYATLITFWDGRKLERLS